MMSTWQNANIRENEYVDRHLAFLVDNDVEVYAAAVRRICGAGGLSWREVVERFDSRLVRAGACNLVTGESVRAVIASVSS